MKLFTRMLSLLLVLCFIGISLIACGNKPQSDETEATEGSNKGNSVSETDTNIYGEPSFTTPNQYNDIDFEGEELTVLLRNNEVTLREWYKESPEDELDEAVAMRNVAVEETLNVKLDYEIFNYGEWNASTAMVNGMIVDDVVQDLHYYDIAVHWALAGGYASIRDCNANLLDKDTFPYFDFSLPCWNQSIVDTTVNNRLHLIAGDINISQFDYAVVIWYNKTLYDKKKEATDHNDIQDLALEGMWTYEEMYLWANKLQEDSNGTPGNQVDDTYGFATLINDNFQPVPKDAVAAAFDIDLLIENPDGTHSYNILGNEKAAKARDMWINLLDAPGSVDDASVSNFAAGKYLFYANMMYPGKDENMTIREMEDKYGLLPMPKYNTEQEQYYTAAYDAYSLMSVLDHAKSTVPTKGDAISAYLQLATEESYTSVRGYYFNRIVKPKYFGQDDSLGTVTKSVTLFDIIISNITFDFWTIYSNQLGDLTWAWRTSLLPDWNSLEAEYLSRQTEFDQKLLEMDTWFGLIESED
ncbi:MAG: hypothetical protein J6M03_02275 [Clostridia bacterium]|nr:hypothetical protein [Clostridia bacterium]